MMLWPSNGRVIDMFSNQFEDDGKGGYLFRRNGMGPATPISAAERDRFVADFKRGWRRISWGIVAGSLATVAISISGIFVLPNHFEAFLYFSLGVGIVPMLVWVLLTDRRMRLVPVRVLAGRATIGDARGREEATELHFARIRWSHIAAPLLGGLIAIGHEAGKVDMMHGWGQLWLLFGAFMIVMTIYVAVRKWQAISG